MGIYLLQVGTAIVEMYMNSKRPIKKRATKHTQQLTEDFSDFLNSNRVGHIDIDVNLEMSTPFPSLNNGSKSLSVPLVDPETVSDLVSELLPDLDGKELSVNSNIIFEKQALLIIEATMYAVLQCLTSLLQQYFPKSEDFEESFKKALSRIKPQIDSLVMDEEMFLGTQISESTKAEFNEIVKYINKEEE